ncbi:MULTISPECIES: hypothetical protein [Planctopirus]|jgi:hypothetical protein|uniref:Uncharacterized protein n=2 Tax=Planctopirus TaxID=1649480 RepID=A0A1C3ET88_9PLAN|nr:MULTISPECIES: hypothetical protein [Planctopirus]ODA36480.1 hypothetical protein A6X21_01995 [Planctopirus hydrillae]QDV28622.1 hypothetical protein Spb1_04850 [Planctopirus ephydatiae]
MAIRVIAVDRTDVAACVMPDRFRHDVTYFASPAGTGDAPAQLSPREYWINAADAKVTLEDGVLTIVSPLDSSSRTELEITEDQERWLEWLVKHNIQHIRLEVGG